jgi:DNA-binding NarL/FixJ family response regulator
MRVVIAEDSWALRDGVVQALTFHGHDVVAAVGDADALRVEVARHRPDAVVVDVRMPPSYTDEGLRAAVELRRAQPDLGVLVFSQNVEVHEATRLLVGQPRGVGYLLKERVANVAEFVAALVRVAEGGTVLDPELVAALVGLSPAVDELAALSPRELEVLELMAAGRTNAAIAKILNVADGTVEKRVAGVFTKLGLPGSGDDNRRVLAVLGYLRARPLVGSGSVGSR